MEEITMLCHFIDAKKYNAIVEYVNIKYPNNAITFSEYSSKDLRYVPTKKGLHVLCPKHMTVTQEMNLARALTGGEIWDQEKKIENASKFVAMRTLPFTSMERNDVLHDTVDTFTKSICGKVSEDGSVANEEDIENSITGLKDIFDVNKDGSLDRDEANIKTKETVSHHIGVEDYWDIPKDVRDELMGLNIDVDNIRSSPDDVIITTDNWIDPFDADSNDDNPEFIEDDSYIETDLQESHIKNDRNSYYCTECDANFGHGESCDCHKGRHDKETNIQEGVVGGFIAGVLAAPVILIGVAVTIAKLIEIKNKIKLKKIVHEYIGSKININKILNQAKDHMSSIIKGHESDFHKYLYKPEETKINVTLSHTYFAYGANTYSTEKEDIDNLVIVGASNNAWWSGLFNAVILKSNVKKYSEYLNKTFSDLNFTIEELDGLSYWDDEEIQLLVDAGLINNDSDEDDYEKLDEVLEDYSVIKVKAVLSAKKFLDDNFKGDGIQETYVEKPHLFEFKIPDREFMESYDPEYFVIQESLFKRKPKQLKPIGRDLIAYIITSINEVEDTNDQAMLSGYICSKLELVDFYITVLDTKDNRYIVPHQRPYLVNMQQQLENLLRQVLKIKPINKNNSVWKVNVNYPENWKG